MKTKISLRSKVKVTQVLHKNSTSLFTLKLNFKITLPHHILITLHVFMTSISKEFLLTFQFRNLASVKLCSHIV